MKNSVIVFFLALTSITAFAQESQERNIGTFSGVSVSEGIDVYLKHGDKESLVVEVTGTKLENVITEVSGSNLKIHMASGNFRGRINVKVHVTYVKLGKLSASSGANIFSDGVVRSETLDLQASSAGNIELKIHANKVRATASSAGQVEIEGKVRTVIADASSGGQVDAYDMEGEDVTAEASSGGSVKVNAQNSLTANASSGGSVRYRGNPAKSMTNSSSGGSVKKSS